MITKEKAKISRTEDVSDNKEQKLSIEEISNKSAIPFSYHKAFWVHKGWTKGKLVYETEYKIEIEKFKNEVF